MYHHFYCPNCDKIKNGAQLLIETKSNVYFLSDGDSNKLGYEFEGSGFIDAANTTREFLCWSCEQPMELRSTEECQHMWFERGSKRNCSLCRLSQEGTVTFHD